MKRKILLLAGGLLAALPAGAPCSDTPQSQIAALGESYVEAFNKGDAGAVASLWLPDGNYVDQFGNRYEGRKAIKTLFVSFFAANGGAQLRIDSESLKMISENLASEDGTSAVLLPGEPLPSRARFANTIVRQDGKWLLACVRESQFAPPDRSKELAPLAWLLGPWQAKTAEGESVFLTVAPAPGGNFLIVERTVVAGGGPVAGGTEWIAWDPSSKQIRSWSFDADGGFGENVWRARDKAWSVESTHTLRDGRTLRETQSLDPDGKGGLTVKTISISLEGSDLPKPEELTFLRPDAK